MCIRDRDYALPDLGQRYPTGFYEVRVRAVDRAGNVTPSANYAVGSVRLDSTPPTISLNEIPSNAPPGDVAAMDRITRTITIGGVITETDTIQAGVGGAEISYTPDIVTDVYSNTLLLLFLDDLAGSRLFRDDSGRQSWLSLIHI